MSIFKKDDEGRDLPVKIQKSIEPVPPTRSVAPLPATPSDEELAAAKAELDEQEKNRKHMRDMHGFFVSKQTGHGIIQMLHEDDHGAANHTVFYTPHKHIDGEVTIEVPDTVPLEWSDSEADGSIHP